MILMLIPAVSGALYLNYLTIHLNAITQTKKSTKTVLP